MIIATIIIIIIITVIGIIATNYINRLEMLGDSFLKFAMSEKLYLLFPERNQGFLTTARSQLVYMFYYIYIN